MKPIRVNQLLKVLLICIVILFGVLLYFGNKKMVVVANKTAQLRAEARAGDKQLAVYKQTKIKVDSLGYVNDLAAKVLPADEEQSVIVAEVSEFAKRSNLLIKDITFLETASAPKPSATGSSQKGVQIIPVSVSLVSGAEYANVLRFLKTAESNQRKMQVTSVSLKPDVDNKSALINAVITMNLYAKQTITKAKP